MAELTLYTYFRSSAAYRVRIALHLKGLPYRARPLHLLRNGGEHKRPAYLALNPQGLVPTLVDEAGVHSQSLAIIEYLDERYPVPPLLPTDPGSRARVRALGQIIACDIHPLNNLRVGEYLKRRLGHGEPQWQIWYRHWIHTGFKAFESLLADSGETGRFCHGDQPTLADVCLVPQVYNARRFHCALEAYPTLCRVTANAEALEAFRRASPDNQPDAE